MFFILSINNGKLFTKVEKKLIKSRVCCSILTKHLARTKKVEQNMTSVSACLQQLSERIGEVYNLAATRVNRSLVFPGPDQVRHKQGCTVIEAG